MESHAVGPTTATIIVLGSPRFPPPLPTNEPPSWCRGFQRGCPRLFHSLKQFIPWRTRPASGEYIFFFEAKKKNQKGKKKNKSTAAAAAAESDYLRDQSSRVCVSSRSFSAVGQWSEFLRTFFTITSYAILCLGSRVIDELQQDRNASLHRRLNSVRSFALFHHFFLFFSFYLFLLSPLLSLYIREIGWNRELRTRGIFLFFYFLFFSPLVKHKPENNYLSMCRMPMIFFHLAARNPGVREEGEEDE